MYSEFPQTKIAAKPLTWGHELDESMSHFKKRSTLAREKDSRIRHTSPKMSIRRKYKEHSKNSFSSSRSRSALSSSAERSSYEKVLRYSGEKQTSSKRRLSKRSNSGASSQCSTAATKARLRPLREYRGGATRYKKLCTGLEGAPLRHTSQRSTYSPKSSRCRRHETDSLTFSSSATCDQESDTTVDSRRPSPSYDSEEEYRRSRSRERHRRKQQYLTIQRFCKSNNDDSQVFWDGFQWVKKGHGAPGYDQLMNATRRARRLHIGNLPLNLNVTEDQFREFLWKAMKDKNLCQDSDQCPIVHVWFAKDRGGNFGFMEMATVEQAICALQLDGITWHDVAININRPTDWKRAINDHAIRLLAGTSGLAIAESVVAASQQAMITGNSTGLDSILSNLPEEHRRAVTELMKAQNIPGVYCEAYTPTGLPVQLVQNKIRAELLKGCPSRTIRIAKPCASVELTNEFSEVLEDVMAECEKHGGIIRALIITPELSLNVKVEIGDIFLEFAGLNQADNCILNLSGRMYEGRPIQMARFSETLWQEHLKPHSENILLKNLGVP